MLIKLLWITLNFFLQKFLEISEDGVEYGYLYFDFGVGTFYPSLIALQRVGS